VIVVSLPGLGYETRQARRARRGCSPSDDNDLPDGWDHPLDHAAIPGSAHAPSGPGGAVLGVGHPEMEWFPSIERYGHRPFTDEFKLHLPGGPYDFPAPAVMAFLSGCGEIISPVLLVLGFGTRFPALGATRRLLGALAQLPS
jgi:hypothetical protein